MWQTEFLKLLSDSTMIPRSSLDQAYALKDANLPAKVYKYRAINSFAISNFETDTVWLSSASRYNDPYECATTWSGKALELATTISNFDKIVEQSGLKTYLSCEQIFRARSSSDPTREITRYFVKTSPNIPEAQHEAIVDELLEAAKKMYEEMIERMNSFFQRGMKICSFSARNDSTVMWGHYANCHTGFSIEYDVSAWHRDEIRRRLLHPVIYTERLFDVTRYLVQPFKTETSNHLFGMLAAIHKSPDWSYENEWRFVLPLGESVEDHDYRMPAPSAIYLGSKINDAHQRQLTEIARKKKVPVYKMKLSTSAFRLVPRQHA